MKNLFWIAKATVVVISTFSMSTEGEAVDTMLASNNIPQFTIK